MKKKIVCVILAIILLLLIAAGVVAFQNRSLIKIMFLDTDTARQNSVDNGEDFRQELEKEIGFSIPEFTDEEKEKIASGELSVSQLLIERIEEYTAEHPEIFTENADDESGETKQYPDRSNASSQEIIVRYTNEFAALRSSYTGALDSLVGAAKAEMQPGKRAEVVARYSGEARALEGSCDAEMESLLGKMEAELSAIGADTSIVSTIRQSYQSEKAAREVYYRDKFASMF